MIQLELLHDIGPGELVGRGGQRDDRDLRETLLEDRQLRVLGAEVMPPMRDTVGLINGDQGDVEAGQEPVGLRLDALGRDIKQLDLSHRAEPLDPLLLAFGERAVERRRRNSVGDQSLHLVFHQGDQRRDDDRCSLQVDGRQLVADGFSATGGHQDK